MSVLQNFKMPQGPADKRQLYLAGAGIAVAVIGIVAFASWQTKPAATNKPKHTETTEFVSKEQADNAYSAVDKAAAEFGAEKAKHDRLMKQAEWERAHPGQTAPGGTGQAAYAGQSSVPPRPPDPEEVKRHDTIHASNIALSFRDGSAAQKPADMKDDLAQQMAKLKEEISHNMNESEALSRPYPIYRDVAPQPPGPAYQYQEPKKGPPEELTAATGPMYRVFEGTIIDSVLTNQLTGSFAGPVSVMVVEPVFSHDHNLILIPKGSRVLGGVKPVSTTGQKRLAMSFDRLIMPDGYSLPLEDVPGMDQQGATGIKDKVDNHWKSIFGTSVALGLISGFSLYGTQGAFNSSGIDQYRQGVSQSVGQSSNRILESKLNEMPDITIRPGHPIKVWLSKDLMLPAYASHKIRGDI